MAHAALLLSVFKPPGWTSFDVVRKIRSLLHFKKVGHAGTLDPAATGVLIVLCGAATKWAGDFEALEKEYLATIRFGVETVTDDITGDILKESQIQDWSPLAIEHALSEFEGDILQVPPIVSAIKLQGERSYRKVRRGETPAIPARQVRISRIELLEIEYPQIEIRVRCSKGTYIRSLARDLGQRLGWGGTLASLIRTAVGSYRTENALTIERVAQMRTELTA
ncbi:tRNA pseudouridine(55) synthase TruB [bacterium]|nr:tRNA pseudouridine(55) synthase TruB [bacterium]